MPSEFRYPSPEKAAGFCEHNNSKDECEVCLEEKRNALHPLEKFDITFARNIEGGRLEKYRPDKRLSEKEAIIYQDYATKKDGIKFSEQASDEAYAEAQEVIDDLRKNESDKN